MQKKILIATLRRCVASPYPVRFASVKSSKPKWWVTFPFYISPLHHLQFIVLCCIKEPRQQIADATTACTALKVLENYSTF